MSDEVEDEVVKHECIECSNEYEEDELITTHDSEYVCTDCVRTCERCEWVGTMNSEWYCVDDSSWCTSCWEDHAWTCRRCDYCYDGDRISYATV